MRKQCPSLGVLEAATKPMTLNTSLAGTHNEGVPIKTPYCCGTEVMAGAHLTSVSRESWFNGSDGIASRKNRGTRQILEGTA